MDFIEPCFGIGHNLSLICQMTSEDIKHQLIIIIIRIFSTMNCEYRPTLLCDPKEHSTQLEPQWLTSHSHRHTRRRGRRAGTLEKFRRRNVRPPLPCAFLSNVRSLKNKADELFFLIQSNRDFKDCCVFCFTETWLDPSIPDSAVQPPGYTLPSG